MGLKENLQVETVSDLPIRDAIVVEASTPIRDAVALMRSKQLGCTVVVDSQGKPLGTFTERTLIHTLLQEPEEAKNGKVGDHIYTKSVFVKLTDPITAVWEALMDKGLRFICVLNEDGSVAGMTGQRGMSEYIAEHYPNQVMVQRIGGKPGLETREGA